MERWSGTVDYRSAESGNVSAVLFGADSLAECISQAMYYCLYYDSIGRIGIEAEIRQECPHCQGVGSIAGKKKRGIFGRPMIRCKECKGNPTLQTIGPIPYRKPESVAVTDKDGVIA